MVREYCWDGEDTEEYVSEEEYAVRMDAIYPEGQGMYPREYYSLDDICSIIRTTAGHSYE